MVIDCYREFRDSGRMQKLREWIDSGSMSPKLEAIFVEVMTVIDCQQAAITEQDERLTLEYQEICRDEL